MVRLVKNLLAHPATRDLSIDDPKTTEERRHIIRGNRFLWRIYDEWYRLISQSIPAGHGQVLELGSGGGFLSQYVPGILLSEIFVCTGIQVVLDARQLPFAAGTLKAIVMVNVLHHIPDSRAFLAEARRCLRPGGAVVMIEPWVSTWSRFIYTRLHHEPFDPRSKDWNFKSDGPLSGSNGALPWIIFERDRRQFEQDFPDFDVRAVQPFMPFRYLVSGGVSMRQLMPEATFGFWRKLESVISGSSGRWPMFALIRIARRTGGSGF